MLKSICLIKFLSFRKSDITCASFAPGTCKIDIILDIIARFASIDPQISYSKTEEPYFIDFVDSAAAA
jgi:hypothetical protein